MKTIHLSCNGSQHHKAVITRVLGMKPFFLQRQQSKFRPYKENKGPKSSRALRSIGPMFGVILPYVSSFPNLNKKKILFQCQRGIRDGSVGKTWILHLTHLNSSFTISNLSLVDILKCWPVSLNLSALPGSWCSLPNPHFWVAKIYIYIYFFFWSPHLGLVLI